MGMKQNWPLQSYAHQLRWALVRIVQMLLILSAVTIVSTLFHTIELDDRNILIVYTLGVLAFSTMTSCILLLLVASFLAVLIYNYLFVAPFYCLWECGKDYFFPFLVMLSASLIGATLACRTRRSREAVVRQAARTQVLLDTSRKLQSAENEQQIISSTAQQIIKLLGRTVVYCPPGASVEEATIFPVGEWDGASRCLDEQEMGAAVQVLKNGISISTEHFLYLPMQGRDRVLGVVGVEIRAGEIDLPDEWERGLLDAILCECSLALDREHAVHARNVIMLQVQREKLCTDLLRAISHDLRTPLTGIAGSASVLIEDQDQLSDVRRIKMYTNIYEEAMWLHALVENLLSVSRIDDGNLRLRTEPQLLEEVIDEALSHVAQQNDDCRIAVDLQGDFLMARMDSQLIVQTLINLVENAMKYTPPNSDIIITAYQEKHNLVVEVADNGQGIPDAEKERIFDRFYIGNGIGRGGRRGLGLGLALCKSIILAHDGTIYVRDNNPHGAIFGFTLWAEEVEYRA